MHDFGPRLSPIPPHGSNSEAATNAGPRTVLTVDRQSSIDAPDTVDERNLVNAVVAARERLPLVGDLDVFVGLVIGHQLVISLVWGAVIRRPTLDVELLSHGGNRRRDH